MELSPSAHVDTFARDHLPPADQWPTLEFTTEALQYPARLNAGAELIDVPADRLGADRPALRTPDGERVDLRRAAPPRRTRSPRCWSRTSAWCPATGCCCARRTTRGRSPRGSACSRPAASSSPRWPRCAPASSTPIVDRDPPVDRAGRPPLRRRRARRSVGPEAASSPTAATSPTTWRRRRRSRRVHRRRRRPPTTSRCSGRPRAAPASPRSPCTSTATCSPSTTPSARPLGLGPGDLVACTAPLAFTFGLGMLVVFPLRAGACALLTEPATPAQLADLVAEHQASPCWRPRRRRTSRS